MSSVKELKKSVSSGDLIIIVASVSVNQTSIRKSENVKDSDNLKPVSDWRAKDE